MQMFACYDKIRTSWLFDYVSENVSGEENTSGPNFGKEFRYYNIEQYIGLLFVQPFFKKDTSSFHHIMF